MKISKAPLAELFPHSMNRKHIIWLYLGLLVYTIGPLLLVFLASTIAQATGSQLNEAEPHPCVVLGIDIGSLLYGMFVMGWFSLLTIPTGILGILGLSMGLLIYRFRASKDGKKGVLEVLALTLVVLSALSIMIMPQLGILLAISGIICGYVAKKRIKRNPELSGKGLANWSMILGCIVVLVGIVRIARLMHAMGKI